MLSITQRETPMASELTSLIDPLCELAEEAGRAVLRYYHGGFTVRTKSDATPITEADEAAEAIILPALHKLLPGVPMISEEAGTQGGTPQHMQRFWAVDPIDGTKEFINRSGEFTVNIALIENNRPILGIVHAPALDVIYSAAGRGSAQRRRDGQPARSIAVRQPRDGLVALASRSHDDNAELTAALARFAVKERRPMGSSLKFCLIAAGEADLYIRLGPTCEWDTAAGHAVLDAAGGTVTLMDGQPLLYRKPGFLNPSFIARGFASVEPL